MAKDICIQYITDEGLAKLKNDFTTNLSEYRAKNHKYFLDLLYKGGYLLDSAYIIKDFRNKLCFEQKKDENDLKNIQIVYDSMRDIPTYIAMDDRFWAGINHTIMWDYIFRRRYGEAFGSNIIDDSEKVFNSFFTHTKRGKKRGTYVNCVSRLWWTGYLTYNEKNKNNPYDLTAEVCKTGFASTIILLSSSNILSRKKTMHALLSSVKSKREEGYKISRNGLVAGISYLNLIAGISLIDIMAYEELEGLLNEFYDNYLKKLPVRV